MTIVKQDQLDWQQVEPGIERAMIAWSQDLMAVKVRFAQGAVGSPHRHSEHDQLTYVIAGRFEVIVDGEQTVLSAGDVFYATKECWHGVTALEEGAVLLDVFTPMRQDFLSDG